MRPTGINPTRIVTFLIGIGGLGVDLFIVLSGFCLFYPLVRRSKNLQTEFKALSFYRRRAYRLLPAYYAALSIVILLILWPGLQPHLVARPIHLSDVLAYSFLVQTFSTNTTGSINGSLWSIALEAQLYLVFPLLIVLYRRWGMKSVFAVGLVAGIAWPSIHHFLVQHVFGEFDPKIHLMARWIEFMAGMLAAKIVCYPIRSGKRWATLCFALTLPLTVALQTGALSRLHVPYLLGYIFAAATFASLVILLAKFPDQVFAGKNRLGLLTQFGAISYSFYLLHQPILLLIAPILRPEKLGVLPTFALSAVTAFPLTLALAYVFFHYIEQPFLQRGKRLRTQPIIEVKVAETSS